MSQKHILVVDDDHAMRDLIADFLASHAFQVSTAPDGAAMTRILKARPVDLVVLDLQLAREDGLDLLRDILAEAYAPVIIVTGHRSEEADKVLGLELGAEDYMTKPLSLRELLARVRMVLRRAEQPERPPRGREPRVRYTFAGWELDTRGRSLMASSREVVRLTAAEFNLLVALLRAPRQVLTREQLITASRVHAEEVNDRSIDVLILRLRRKLEVDPTDPRIIRTERGAGYMLGVPVETIRGPG
ncbi:response regulator [Arenibaculum pallidiluteum]|uniref:response regulator n=1 Tax=Arenibaculum pallidiluteum TaxID=2812559 RepID=UPI001A97466A|nr:response regulator [Arenibaculum pallidiluteum]